MLVSRRYNLLISGLNKNILVIKKLHLRTDWNRLGSAKKGKTAE
jgi:hypothetical protein